MSHSTHTWLKEGLVKRLAEEIVRAFYQFFQSLLLRKAHWAPRVLCFLCIESSVGSTICVFMDVVFVTAFSTSRVAFVVHHSMAIVKAVEALHCVCCHTTIRIMWMGPSTKISLWCVKSPPTSNMVFMTTMEPWLERCSREHLSDIEIVKIFALEKMSTFQWETVSLIKCSRNAIWKQSCPSSLKPFNAMTNVKNINARQHNVKITILNMFWSRTIYFHYMISQISFRIKDIRFQQQPSDIGTQKRVVEAIFQVQNLGYMLKILVNDLNGLWSIQIRLQKIGSAWYGQMNIAFGLG